MKGSTLQKAREAIDKWRVEVKIEGSEANLKWKKHLEDEAKKQKDYNLFVESIKKELEKFESISDYFNSIEVATDEIYEALITITSKVGRPLTDDEYRIVNNPFLGTSHYYDKHVFGYMHGQGTCPWVAEYDFGPTQLSLFNE